MRDKDFPDDDYAIFVPIDHGQRFVIEQEQQRALLDPPLNVARPPNLYYQLLQGILVSAENLIAEDGPQSKQGKVHGGPISVRSPFASKH